MSTAAEAVAREFAAQFPGPNVQLAINLAEDRLVTWEQLVDLFKKVLADAIKEVAE